MTDGNNKTMTALYLALILPCIHASGASGTTPGTVTLKRSVENSIASTLNLTDLSNGTGCTFDGASITLSHPMSLKPSDQFFSIGQLQLKSIELMVDAINTVRCGVHVNGTNHALELSTYGDDSSKEKVDAILQHMSYDDISNFWLGPYSSGLTGVMSPYATETNTVLIAGGAAATSVFANHTSVFGTFPPTSMYLAQAIEALSKAGAKTAAAVYESASFTTGVCAALPALAQQFGLDVLSMTEIVSSPTSDDLDPVAKNFSAAESNPDVVVTCVYDQGCSQWITSLRNARWTPRAQVFTVCIGMDSFVEAVGDDAKYMMGISPWDSSLTMQDAVVGWSAAEFAQLFFDYTSRTSTYHSASAAASVGVLVQAIEKAKSFDPEKIIEVLSEESFTTLYGNVGFDSNGQSQAPSLFLQYDVNSTVQTVYPPEAKSGDLVYPMPTWDNRDCLFVSGCESTTASATTVQGQCQGDGSCKCSDDTAISSGVGSSAKCVYVPVEDQTLISTSLLVTGYVLFGIQALFSFFCGAWTIRYRNTRVVKSGQPIFLCLVCLGAFVMNLAIIPIGIQGEYRYLQDPITGEMTTESSQEVGKLDAACMAFPWLFSTGFSLLFSALFAKIWRIFLVWKASMNFTTKKVRPMDVAVIVLGTLAIQVSLLLSWQIIDPLMWQRDVVSQDVNGYTTQSVGSCQSTGGQSIFLALLVAVDGLMLLCALCLIYRTRKVPSEFHEGKWITAAVLSIFQILALGIPIIVIIENSSKDVQYFIQAALIFLMSLTPTAFIFIPKMHRHHIRLNGDSLGQGDNQINSSVQPARRSSCNSTAPNTNNFSVDAIRKRTSTVGNGGQQSILEKGLISGMAEGEDSKVHSRDLADGKKGASSLSTLHAQMMGVIDRLKVIPCEVTAEEEREQLIAEMMALVAKSAETVQDTEFEDV